MASITREASQPVARTTLAQRPMHPEGSLIYLGPAAATPPHRPPCDAAGPPLVTEGVRVPSKPVTRGHQHGKMIIVFGLMLYSAKNYFPITAPTQFPWKMIVRGDGGDDFGMIWDGSTHGWATDATEKTGSVVGLAHLL